MTGLRIETTASFERNQERAGNEPTCIRCGKVVGEHALWVHMSTAWEAVPVEAVLDEADDQGWWPIGSDCARRLPKAYVKRDDILDALGR